MAKWENGTSVPDTDMLIRLAGILDTSVATLLGDMMETATDKADENVISLQLKGNIDMSVLFKVFLLIRYMINPYIRIQQHNIL